VALIRSQVQKCEIEGITILCCPEAILGGLADFAEEPARCAVPTACLGSLLAPLASKTVTTIVGFSELSSDGRLYNSAAVLQNGGVAGVYRKNHPAIRQSVYHAGTEAPVFRVGRFVFGIAICYDTNFPDLAARIVAQGADALFVPTNNALPHNRSTTDVAAEARACDVALATKNRVWIVRADVAGSTGEFSSVGTSRIVRPDGSIVIEGRPLTEDVLVAEVHAGELGGVMAKTKTPRKKDTRLKVTTKALPAHRREMVKGAKVPSPTGPIPIPYPNVSQKKS
jgi:predicted amidohydrolase